MLKPLNQVLLVKLLLFQKSKVDITITEDEKEKNLILGEVTAIPSNSNFQIGDHVIFGKYAYETFTFEGEDYHFLREEDVIAIKVKD